MIVSTFRRLYNRTHEFLRNLFAGLDYLGWLVADSSRNDRFDKKDIDNVLVVLINKTKGNIGGDFCTLGVINNFMREHSEVKVSMLGDANTLKQFKGLTKANMLSYKNRKDLESLKKKGFKAVIILNLGGALDLKDFWFIPIKIGKTVNAIKPFFNFKNRFGYTKKVYNPIKHHMVDLRYSLIEALGFRIRKKELKLSFNKHELKKVDEFLKKNKIEKFIVVHPGGKYMVENLKKGKWPPHLWNPERYAKVVDHFSNKGYKVLISGAPDERELAEKINFLSKNGIVNCCGLFSINETGVLLKKSKLLIATDTGIVHIAYQTGIPIVELFGPSIPEVVGAWPLESKKHEILVDDGPCSRSMRKLPFKDNFNCLDRIKTEEVIKAAEKLLSLN